jgi:hypothetical protein
MYILVGTWLIIPAISILPPLRVITTPAAVRALDKSDGNDCDCRNESASVTFASLRFTGRFGCTARIAPTDKTV